MLGVLAGLGRSTTRRFSAIGGPARFAFQAVTALPSLPGAGRRVALRVLLNQLRFTALQAVPLVVLLSGVLSFIVILLTRRQLGDIGGEIIGTLMVVSIVRLLGPLLTALAVVGRSGTAITAELATNTVLGEIRALEGMGIDPFHYLVLPRLAGSVVSVTLLLVLFDGVALLAGYLATSVTQASGGRYLANVLAALTTSDVVLSVVKGVLFGGIVGLLPSYHGLRVTRGPTEIPQAVTRGTVASIALIFITAALLMFLFRA
ncbi:MAG TPA: ABC transporter permease [Gemmatimonadales bacterium]|nr:ABC transporter permease [Gemmatimonadales bacterium]